MMSDGVVCRCVDVLRYWCYGRAGDVVVWWMYRWCDGVVVLGVLVVWRYGGKWSVDVGGVGGVVVWWCVEGGMVV